MRIQIYIPAERAKDKTPAEALASVGLDHFKGFNTGEGVGPDEGRGLFVAFNDSANIALGYDQPNQTWLSSFVSGDRESGAYWLGYTTAHPPTESDLRRPDARDGKFITLSNGEAWKITTPDTLDRFPMRGTDGKLEWMVDEQFNWLTADLAKRMETSIVRGDDDSVSIVFDDEADFDFFVRLLCVNYRLTEELVCELKLLNRSSMREIVVGLMGLELKKETA